MQRLLNFDVAIEPLGIGYRTRVISSPAGEAAADFTLPFTNEHLTIFILQVAQSIGRAHHAPRRIESRERRLIEDFGTKLFQSAFSGSARECLERSRLAADIKGAGLRIRLRLPPELADIPWEYLHDDEYGFIGLSPETTLVRYVEIPKPPRPFAIRPPLRILAMISTPSGTSRLQTDQEWDKLNDSLKELRRLGMVHVDRLPTGTLAALQRLLRAHDYHVLHFIGHGYYDDDNQDGALALESAEGKIRLVTGRDLGLMIRGHKPLRLVVLNACEGARTSRDDPFGGVALSLVRQGIPAVAAMQFEISDRAALAFSPSFYQAIADDLPIDMAMVEARRAMFAEGHEVEWATPVLYLRSPDGRVFTGRTIQSQRNISAANAPGAAEGAEPTELEQRQRSSDNIADLGAVNAAHDEHPGELVLQVRYDAYRNAYRFQFLDEYDRPDEMVASDAGPIVEQLVRRMGQLAERSDASAAQGRRLLIHYGIQLWQELIPEGLRSQFWERRDRIKQLTILADRDIIPWELLYPRDRDHDAGFLVDQFPVTRAVYGRRPPRHLRLHPVFFVGSQESASEAAAEAGSLARIHDTTPTRVSELDPLLRLINGGGFGLLHFAGTRFDPDDGSIGLNVPFSPILLTKAASERSLAEAAPMVVFDARRVAGHALTYTRLDRWAQRLMQAGAAAVIGPLWPVADHIAQKFVMELYRSLLNGYTLGDAAMAARRAIDEFPRESAWLAYSVYGDPQAKVGPRSANQ